MSEQFPAHPRRPGAEFTHDEWGRYVTERGRWERACRETAARVFPELSPTTRITLVKAGYRARWVVQRASDADLLAHRNIGPGRLADIRAVMPHTRLEDDEWPRYGKTSAT